MDSTLGYGPWDPWFGSRLGERLCLSVSDPVVTKRKAPIVSFSMGHTGASRKSPNDSPRSYAKSNRLPTLDSFSVMEKRRRTAVR